MKRIQTQIVTFDELDNIDLFIASSGYEMRSSTLADKVSKKMIHTTKVCLSFINYKDNKNRKHNDTIFEKLGFQFLFSDGDSSTEIEFFLKKYLDAFNEKKESINILVDYSVMTRIWYGSILKLLYNCDSVSIRVYFSYSFSEFEPPSKTIVRNIHVSPIGGYSTLLFPDRPTALVLGLGYEPEKALGLSEYFDAETFLFYNDNSSDSRFTNLVESSNWPLISTTPSDNIFRYPIKMLDSTESILYDLCSSLNSKYRVIIAPCGPKPFSLISFIVSLRIPGVDVWRISPGNNIKILDRKSSGLFSIYGVFFE